MHTAPPSISRSIPGEPDHAVVRLFDACAPELFALALAVSGDADVAEEAVFDAFSAAMDLAAPPTRAAMAMRVRAAVLSRVSSDLGDVEPDGDGDRCALELACYARLPVAEIAAELSIPADQVKRRLSAGLRATGRATAAIGMTRGAPDR
jgi:DNA-directed RNA polymerase specialized sigma24 family protein